MLPDSINTYQEQYEEWVESHCPRDCPHFMVGNDCNADKCIIDLVNERSVSRMNKAFEKILERLEATNDIAQDDSVAEIVSTRIWNKAIHRAKQIVKEVAEEYNGGWIACSERFPEEGEDVLVWYEYFRYGNYNRLFQTMGISYVYNGKWSGFVNGSSGWSQLRIIVWQHLPEPFKERDNK